MRPFLPKCSERSDARGLGRTLPGAPQGLSRSDWGVELTGLFCQNARSGATQEVWGERSPVPLRGCHEVTGG